jgi:biopolymer transport protein ExbB
MSDHLSLYLVKATFVALIAASALTWAIAIVKLLQQLRLARQTQQFERAFDRFSGLPPVDELNKHHGPFARVAQAGALAWRDSAHPQRANAGDRDQDGDAGQLDVRRDLLERSLRQQLQRERRGIESGLPILASIGSTAPFVGLFGTVLGIIHALTSIGRSGSASLEVVAGPIGEALVATAIGIAVAVPAVLAYNFFLRRLKTFAGELEDFANGFVGSAIKSSIRPARESGSYDHHLDLAREASL